MGRKWSSLTQLQKVQALHAACASRGFTPGLVVPRGDFDQLVMMAMEVGALQSIQSYIALGHAAELWHVTPGEGGGRRGENRGHITWLEAPPHLEVGGASRAATAQPTMAPAIPA